MDPTTYIKMKIYKNHYLLAMVELALIRASTGPEAIESRMPYISIFPPKLCSIHLCIPEVTVNEFSIHKRTHRKNRKEKKKKKD